MGEPTKAAADAISNGTIDWVKWAIVFGWSTLAGIVGCLWWFIQRMIKKLDKKHEDEKAQISTSHDKMARRMDDHSGRLRALEASSVRRTEHENAMGQIYQRIEDSNRETRQRLDKVLELLVSNGKPNG